MSRLSPGQAIGIAQATLQLALFHFIPAEEALPKAKAALAMRCSKCQSDNPDATNFCGKCGAPLTADARMAESLTKTMATPLPVIAKDNLIAGKYRIIEEVGAGGMGIVYKAEDLKLKRCVALKFLPPHLMDSPELRERFLIEAQAAAALSHPNICVIHEVGEAEDRPYIAMEFVEGETLRDRVKKGPIKPEEALAAAIQIAGGLAEAHHKGIIHRDIKSANIMITEKGQAKVMDFGLAKLHGGSSLTKSRTTLGTVAYMSPEQARGEDLDARTDLWSLGVVLYEMLTGRLPFKGDHDQTVIHAILHREPTPPSKIQTGLPSDLDDIVRRALAKNATERYQTMEDFREDLAAVAEGLKPLKAKRRMRRTILGLNPAFLLQGALAVLLILFGLNAGGVRDRIFGGRGGAEATIRLAVLPFANLTGDPEQEYLNDGLTQEMIAQLGRLHPQSLSVIARTSVMRYKKTDTPIDQIGRELGVDYVLEGSAQREANRIRISAELIQVRDQTQLWADVYEREISGILALQNDVAEKVARALALKLLPSEQTRLVSSRTVNPEAYEAYLKGSYHWKKLKAADIETAQRYFEMALAKDPSYAPAYEGLAWVWSARQQMGIIPPHEAGPKAKAAAQKAITLDDSSAEAHEALAVVMTWTDWDWAGAEPEYRRALEINPSAANTLAYYSYLLEIIGRSEEALPHIERALELDPFNALFFSLYAGVLNYHARYDDAVTAARKALAMQPDAPIALSQLELALMATGRREERLALQRERYAGDPERLEALERGLMEGGYEGAQRRIAEVGAARYEKAGRVDALDIAMLYFGAGDKDRTMDWLEKAYEDHEPNLPTIGRPIWNPLRSNPRFGALLRRIGLPLDEKK